MKPIFIDIYKAARVYWDTRFNDIHIPLSYDFARRLLLAYPDADEAVVIPARRWWWMGKAVVLNSHKELKNESDASNPSYCLA